MSDLAKHVKVLMIHRGVRQKDVVNRFGIDKADVSKVINGERHTKRVRQAIADTLSLPLEDVFPPPMCN